MYKLKLSDLEKFEDLLTEAFFNDPLFIAFAKNEETRRKVTFPIFKLMLEFSPGEIELYSPTKKMEGIAIWANQHKKQKNKGQFWELVSKVTKELGFLKLLKIMWISKKLMKHHDEVLDKSDYHLYIIAVDPKYKGQGFASKLIKPMLAKFDKEKLVCSLDTNNEKNVGLYEHFGFKLEVIDESSKSLKDFNMLRVPQ
jgi:ribosomal protein S18 acetylase RimI-like enzyme